MAAPTPVTLSSVVPAGAALTEGFSHRIGFARRPTVGMWFKKSKPMGFDNGGGIDTTTQERAVGDLHTKAAPALLEATDLTGSVAYDPDDIQYIRTTLMGRGNEGAVTYFYSNGSTVTFFGYIDKFDPQDTAEKEQPMANITVVVTNWDPVNRVYAGPVYSAAVGT
jgi:hypothetical protein